jgi:serine/threonine-protein kinase
MSEPSGMLGRLLGSYRVLALLGSGGMGHVYRAYDERLQRAVAIKLLKPSDAPGEGRSRLLREARAAAALNHPNICTVYDVGEVDGCAYIAMELVEGEPLHHAIPKGTGLPPERVVDYGRQIADALSHAHAQGVLHRDLKTLNIVVTPAGRAKVLDFGLAKRMATDATTTGLATVQTVSGALLGTPAYMAPEQLRGAPADVRSDVWALGVVLHEMAAGDRPFAGETPFAMSSAILHEAARPLPDTVPRGLQSVIARCLEKNPASRFQAATEVQAALEAVGVDAAMAAPVAPASRWLPGGAVLTRIAALLALLILAAVAVTNLEELRQWLTPRPPLFDSVAVLPLRNLSGSAEQEFLADGLQQAIITELAQLREFQKVTAAGSTRRVEQTTQTPAEIGRALGVRALVTGSVARTGDRIVVAAQLIDAATERQVWGATYDRDAGDIIALQNDVVSAIAGAIQLRLRPEDRERIAARSTIKPATYELYLRGMHLLAEDRGEGNVRGALKLLQQAVDNDPGDPYAYVGLARGYAVLGHGPAATEDAWNRARTAAERALTLAPDLVEAHAVIGDVKLYFDWDWAGAERAFQRVNELNPSLAINHYRYAWYLFLVDRLDEAIREHERARDLDPLTPLHTTWLADLYRAAKRYDEAIATAEASLDANPNAAQAWSVLSHVYSDMGRHEEAIAAAERAVELAPPQTFALGVAYARAGRLDDARRVRQVMDARPRTPYSMWARAMLYLHLGDADAFFDAIAFEPHHAFVPWVRTDAALDRFRSDPRYAALMARFKLPAPTAAR